MKEKFEIIRPYNDAEIAPAMQRVINSPLFINIVNYLYDDKKYEEVIDMLKNIDSIYMFQKIFSDYAVKKILSKTASKFTYGGIENLDNKKAYLFIANHRDIVLDSAIMQIVLFNNNHKTSQITFGSNLMSNEFIIDLGKMNKMFTLYRGGNRNEQYQNALLHSAYINNTIKEEKESVWIAQKDGRTKDGNDKTQSGLIKMLSLKSENICDTLENLNIVPVCISYEYEPCDLFKVKQLYYSENGKYIKSPNEDFENVLYGITAFKGRVHLQFGKALNEFISNLSGLPLTPNEVVEAVVKEIDRQIHINYILNANNYIAFDILNNSKRFIDKKYNKQDSEKFNEYVNSKLNLIEGNKTTLKLYFYNIYANPVINFLSHQ